MGQSSLRTFDGGGGDNAGEDISVLKVNYTVESGEDGPHPVVHVFGRTRDGEGRHVRVAGFRPYFYAPTEEIEDGIEEDERVTGKETGYESIDGDDLTRIYTRIPADVGEVRESYTHYEADILFPNRFRIDKDVKSGLRLETEGEETVEVEAEEVEPCDADAPARTCVLDIEVDDRNGFPEEGEEPIICVAVWDSFDEEYQMFVWDIDEERVDADDYVLHAYEEEEDMLDAFLAYLDERDADVLTGWNSNDFDLPYIIDRLERLEGEGMEPERLSRVGDVWHDDWGGPTIKGRATFDLLYAYQRMKFTELESYRLDAIAEEELGESKVTYTGKIGDLWEDDPDKLLEYNKMDVELCVRIDDKVGVIDFFRELARFVGCSLEDATTPSDVVDIYVLRKAHGKFVLPSKRGGGGGEEYEGGEVFEPITGIRENVAVLDLASLYPMSMISVNASPETKVDEDYGGETFDVEMPDGKVVRFRKEPEGLTKSIVTELLEERDKKKAARDEHEMGGEEYVKYDNQQNAIKVVMNCFDRETEVVGEKGVKRIDEVDVGEKLYTIDPETREVETKRVVETQEYDYEGEMIDIETRYMDFSVTPNHRMLVDAGGDGEAEFVEAGDLDDYTNYQIPLGEPVKGRKSDTFSLLEEGDAGTAYVYTDGHGATYKRAVGDAADALEYESNRKAYRCEPAHVVENPEVATEADEVLVQRGAKHSSVPAEYEMEDWLRFVGWYVAEGSVYETQPKEYENATRGRSKKIQLGQLNDEGRERIVSLLEQMGLSPREEARQISVCNAVIADWLTENCGSGSADKRLPEFVFELDASLLEHLFDALTRGDGDTHSGIRYSTKSDRLKDDMVRLAIHIGYKPLVNSDSGVWRIRFSDNKGAFRTHRNGGTSESDGKVYCVTMEDNHTVLAGKEGYFQWTGNSYYGVAGYPRFRLYDREMGSAVTATGRKVIEHTKEVVEDEGYEVVYGDTDSTLVELGDGDLDTLVSRGESIEETVNESYDDFAVEEFNAREHRWEIEFEKLYRRFFQAGRKKRYAGRLVWKEGKEVDDLDITGFEYKRSDVAQVTKEVQKEVIRKVLEGKGFDEISEYLRGKVKEFKQGEFECDVHEYDYVGIPGGIGQKLDSYDTDTAQVKGARYANENLGTNFTSGSKPKRLYVKRVKGDYPTTDVVCFEYPEQIPDEFEIDWDKMLEKTVQGPIERILEALDWSWSEVVTGQRQQGLGSFT